MAYRALRLDRGEHMIYIGEGKHNATAGWAFHRLLERRWEQVEQLKLPGWSRQDKLTVYRRQPRPGDLPTGLEDAPTG
jgi:hypothetical protein